MRLIIDGISFLQKIILYFSLFLFLLPKYKGLTCNKTRPILKDNTCDSIYCTEEEFTSTTCIINNDIIKTQWLTNILEISNIYSRFIHPFLTSNNDLIIQTTSTIATGDRNYYGLTNEGRYFFTDENGEETPYYSISVTNNGEQIYKYEGAAAAIQIANDDNNYFLSIGNNNGYAEIIDYKNNNAYMKLSSKFYIVTIVSEVGSIFLMTKYPSDSDQKKYYILSFITIMSSEYYFMVKIYYFTSPDISNDYKRVVFRFSKCANRRIASCFQSSTTYYIYCFYQKTNFEFFAAVYQPDLELTMLKEKKIDSGDSGTDNEYIFFKCIYLVDNVGFYFYYKSISSTTPSIAIREWDLHELFKEYKKFKEIFTLSKYAFNSHVQLNDLIRIKEHQICLASISKNKQILYITIFNFYNDYGELVIRYYSFPIYELYHKKVLFDLKLTEFGQFLTLASSFCNDINCESNSNEHSSYLMIFGYPNSTDINFDYIEYLSKKNENSDIILNLREYMTEVKIENNIFGYVYKGIKILSVPDKITLKSMTYNTYITQNYYLQDNEITSISISWVNQNAIEKYSIKYAVVCSDPEYNELYNYVTYKNDSLGNDEEENKYIYEYIDEYVGRTSYFTIIKKGILTTDCENEFCSLCEIEDGNKYCIVCEKEYFISNGRKICPIPIETTLPLPLTTVIDANPETTIIPIETTLPLPKTTIIIPEADTQKIITTNLNIITTEIINNQICSNNDILQNNCHGKITNEQYELIYQNLKEQLRNRNSTDGNLLLITDNVVFQLSSLKEQNNLNSDNLYVSNVDLDECEKIIKEKENLTDDDDLIILKTDTKSDDQKVTYVQYEIYNPYTRKIINLDICSNVSIHVYTPVVIPPGSESLYNSGASYGYNLYDPENSFYNDICSTYTTENGTDITLSDRKNEIYNNNLKNNTLCQNDCTFVSYNSTTKKAKCDCSVQTEEIIADFNVVNVKNLIKDSLINTLKNSNFLVLKCYKLVFSLKGQIRNIGSYIMIILFLANFIMMIIYFILGRKRTHIMIQEIIFYKKENQNINTQKGKKSGPLITETKKNKKKDNIFRTQMDPKLLKKQKKMNNNNKSNDINISTLKKEKIKTDPPSKKKNNSKTTLKQSLTKPKQRKNNSPNKKDIKNNSEIQSQKGKNAIRILNTISNNLDKKQNKKDNKNQLNKKETTNKNSFSSIGLINVKKKPKSKLNNFSKKDNKPYYLNDQELNTLDYELALKLDKRTYFQYYFSLLKKKHLILFTFLPTRDYNLFIIKFSLFLLSFSLYFSFNGLFFTDDTMHNLYVNNGGFDILYHLSQIIYSSVISALVNTVLRTLSLSENNILKLKSEKIVSNAIEKSKRIEKCLNVKMIIFYISSILLMGFFWYYVACFCAVYKNTQKILIEDTLISFAISMLYPIGLNLIPGIFRIPALREPNKNKKCLYKFSVYVSFFT